MRRFFCAFLAVLLLAALWIPATAVLPQHEGIALITQAVQTSVGTDTPGAAAVLLENGDRILFEGYGYADINTRDLVTVETAFELGEISSLFVLLAAQKLAQEQHLELDRDVSYYLPGDFAKKLDLSHAVTMNDLLSGRASFADRYLDLRYEKSSLVFDTLEEALLAVPPVQTDVPGSHYAYSRFGITLAAFVVECVSGTDYASYVNENILKPLGMTHTLLAPHAGECEKMAVGHVAKGEGRFAVAQGSGRTYSALWPADGAISNAVDLSLLMQYLLNNASLATSALENGIFQTGMAGLAVSGAMRGVRASTPYYTASLCFDFENARAALVLCNTASSVLTDATYTYCGFVRGATVTTGGEGLPDPAQFEGEYILRTKESGALLSRATKNVQVSTEADGTLVFGDVRLVQVAPGVFADPAMKDRAVLQFVTDVEGEVVDVITVDGKSYRPAAFLERDSIARVFFILLVVGAVYFFLGGVLALFDALLSRARGERRPRAWRFTLPWVLAAVNALIVLVQLLVCHGFGAGTIASFLTACATVSLIAVIGAVCGFVYALFTGFTVRRMTGRVARSAILYVLFLILCTYWGVVLL